MVHSWKLLEIISDKGTSESLQEKKLDGLVSQSRYWPWNNEAKVNNEDIQDMYGSSDTHILVAKWFVFSLMLFVHSCMKSDCSYKIFIEESPDLKQVNSGQSLKVWGLSANFFFLFKASGEESLSESNHGFR